MVNTLLLARRPSVRSIKLAKGREELRAQLWPNVDAKLLWSRKVANGFGTVPRTLPVMMVSMDTLSVGKPISTTYLDLWCRCFDEAFVRLDRPAQMAFAAGFTTARGIHLWHARLDRLKELGFIELAEGPQGTRSFALLYNPYLVFRNLHRTGQLQSKFYNAIVAQAAEVGATDLSEDANQETFVEQARA